MKALITTCTLAAAVLVASAATARGQGNFRNLNFEQARLVPIPGDINGAVEFTNAFPGWVGYYGDWMVTKVIPNGVPISWTYDPFIVICTAPATIYQGNFMACYSGGYGFNPGNWVAASLAQTGRVPANAKSIRFLGNKEANYTCFVTLGGSYISIYDLGSSGTYGELWAGDISMFAGQTAELRFSGGWTSLDDIQFLTTAIPEPEVIWFLVALVGVAASRVLRRHFDPEHSRRPCSKRPN